MLPSWLISGLTGSRMSAHWATRCGSSVSESMKKAASGSAAPLRLLIAMVKMTVSVTRLRQPRKRQPVNLRGTAAVTAIEEIATGVTATAVTDLAGARVTAADRHAVTVMTASQATASVALKHFRLFKCNSIAIANYSY